MSDDTPRGSSHEGDKIDPKETKIADSGPFDTLFTKSPIDRVVVGQCLVVLQDASYRTTTIWCNARGNSA